MIIGEYPCCDGPLLLAMPAGAPAGLCLPAYSREDCPHCGEAVWHRFSQWEPMSWTEADFLTEHSVDEEQRTITAKPGTDAAKFAEANGSK